MGLPSHEVVQSSSAVGYIPVKLCHQLHCAQFLNSFFVLVQICWQDQFSMPLYFSAHLSHVGYMDLGVGFT